MAGRLVRELSRKLPEEAKAAKVRTSPFTGGCWRNSATTAGKCTRCTSGGIIVAAVAHEENEYDRHTLPEVLAWAEAFQGERPKVGIVDRGYRGARWVGETEILVPDKAPKDQSKRERQAMKKRFRRRCAIEPLIGHLKSDYRMGRNCLRGFAGDQINLLLAAAAWTSASGCASPPLFGATYIWHSDPSS